MSILILEMCSYLNFMLIKCITRGFLQDNLDSDLCLHCKGHHNFRTANNGGAVK